MMIDWLTATVPLRHSEPINSGYVASVNDDGTLQWRVSKRVSIEGSFSGTMTIKSGPGFNNGLISTVIISGNPVKFLQGHNLWGSTDLRELTVDAVSLLAKKRGVVIHHEDMAAIRAGQFDVSRIDLNQMFDMGSIENVHAWLRMAKVHASVQYRGRARSVGDTAYWGQGSSYWSMKAYGKGEEVKRHPFHNMLPMRLELTKWAMPMLRVEATLRRRELHRNGYRSASSLMAPGVLDKLMAAYMEKLNLPDNYVLPLEALKALPGAVRMTYQSWRGGVDVRSVLPRATFYRHRKTLLAQGIDITTPPSTGGFKAPERIELRQVLSMRPAEVPSWANDAGLVYVPGKRAA